MLSPRLKEISRTPDRDFRCVYPCEIFLSHIPVPALGENKKNEQPHSCRTSFCDAIVMLKWRRHATFQRVQDVLEVSKGAKIRNRYNQVAHLTHDTNGKMTNSQLDTTNESQGVSPGDHKAQITRRAQRHTKTRQKKHKSLFRVFPI